MKTLKTTLVLFILLYSCKGHTQDYGKEDMKINDYLVKTVGYSKELSDSVEPYQQALGVEGLSFKRIPPYDPQTDDAQNWIRIGNYSSSNFSKITINEGEWVSSFSISDLRFQISLGDRIFKIGDSKNETLEKLDLGYIFHKDNPNVARVFYHDAFFYISFKEEKINHFKFENTSY